MVLGRRRKIASISLSGFERRIVGADGKGIWVYSLRKSDMDKKLFDQLLESANQAVEIARGEREPSRVFTVTSDVVRDIRKSSGSSLDRNQE